jgi:hypothetical protein
MSQAGKLSSSDALRGLRPDQVNRDPGDETDVKPDPWNLELLKKQADELDELDQ